MHAGIVRADAAAVGKRDLRKIAGASGAQRKQAIELAQAARVLAAAEPAGVVAHGVQAIRLDAAFVQRQVADLKRELLDAEAELRRARIALERAAGWMPVPVKGRQ